MRKIIVQEFITLDGVMQAPGGSKEDTAEGFLYGGWTAPFFDTVASEAEEFMKRWMESTDIMLGRKTFDIFAGYWPEHEDMWPGINDVTKYCVSSNLDKSDWNNTVFLKNVEEIKAVKDQEGGPIKVHGSSNLAQTLFKHGLVDELVLMTFPIVLGKGKRLFAEDSQPSSFKMTDKLVTSNGVILAYYELTEEKIKTGEMG